MRDGKRADWDVGHKNAHHLALVKIQKKTRLGRETRNRKEYVKKLVSAYSLASRTN